MQITSIQEQSQVCQCKLIQFWVLCCVKFDSNKCNADYRKFVLIEQDAWRDRIGSSVFGEQLLATNYSISPRHLFMLHAMHCINGSSKDYVLALKHHIENHSWHMIIFGPFSGGKASSALLETRGLISSLDLSSMLCLVIAWDIQSSVDEHKEAPKSRANDTSHTKEEQQHNHPTVADFLWRRVFRDTRLEVTLLWRVIRLSDAD